MKFGSKGQIPYIELNGEEIPDSNIIISRFVFIFYIIKRLLMSCSTKSVAKRTSDFKMIKWSNLSLRLKSHFGKDPDDACSPQDLAIGHAVTGWDWFHYCFIVYPCISSICIWSCCHRYVDVKESGAFASTFMFLSWSLPFFYLIHTSLSKSVSFRPRWTSSCSRWLPLQIRPPHARLSQVTWNP